MATLAVNDGVSSQDAVTERMKRMSENVSETFRTKLGIYRGLECGMILHPLGGMEDDLDGAVRCRDQLL